MIPLVFSFFEGERVITNGLRVTRQGDYAEWNDIFGGKINADIIINGSSKAWVHVSPLILDSLLGSNSYNLGLDGHNFFLQHCKFLTYLKYNSPPKLVIEVVGMETLEKRTDLYNYTQFLPYLDDPDIKEATKKYVGFNFFDYNVPFVRYIGQEPIITIGLLEYFGLKNYKNDKYKGYRANTKSWDNSFDLYKNNFPNGKPVVIHQESVKLFDDYLKYCKANKIEVVLAFSPEYYEAHSYTTNRNEVMGIFKSLAAKYNFLFKDYSTENLNRRKELFYNSQHLNKEGSELFSGMLANDIYQFYYLNPRAKVAAIGN